MTPLAFYIPSNLALVNPQVLTPLSVILLSYTPSNLALVTPQVMTDPPHTASQ